LLEKEIAQVFVVIRIEAHEDADVRHGSPGISFLLAGLGADRADRVELELLLGSMKLLAQDATRQERGGRAGLRASELRLIFV
jgi:hypothetical protein